MKNWIRVGVIGVDAGLCWVGDPCYFKDAPTKKWGEFCESIEDMRDAKQINYSHGHPGLGVVCRSGAGDGMYPVYIKKRGDDVTAIMVDFEGDAEE